MEANTRFSICRHITPCHIFRSGGKDVLKVIAADEQAESVGSRSRLNKTNSLSKSLSNSFSNSFNQKVTSVEVSKLDKTSSFSRLFKKVNSVKDSPSFQVSGTLCFPDDSLNPGQKVDQSDKRTTGRTASLKIASNLSESPGQYVYKLLDLSSAAFLADLSNETKMCKVLVHESSTENEISYHMPTTDAAHIEATISCDIWALSATLFHLVSGVHPNSLSAEQQPPDIRDHAPEHLRSDISDAFAQTLKRGLETRREMMYSSLDDMASDLHGCLVQRGEDMYTVFISYRVFSEKFHAMLLYEVLNNTITPAGNRVIVYLDAKRLVKGEDWEQGFTVGLFNSLVAIPLISKGMIDPLVRLKGEEGDPEDNVEKELLIMQTMLDGCMGTQSSKSKLASIFPILIGQPSPKDNSSYPYSTNFFSDGSSASLRLLADKASPPAMRAVHNFLERNGVSCNVQERAVSESVRSLLALQGAQLWNHGALPPEEIAEDAEIASRLAAHPPNPALDLQQLSALKAELRALVQDIHAVIDRAHKLVDQKSAAGNLEDRAFIRSAWSAWRDIAINGKNKNADLHSR